MKKLLKWCLMLTFLIAMTLACSIGADAAYYEPDGTSSTEYLFDAAECNRTLVVNCVDANGDLIKQVNFMTKKGEEDTAILYLYGYDFYAFESTQGLWETCKLRWYSGNGVLAADINILYKFISGLSKDTMTVTVTCRKQEINIKTYHAGRSDAGIEYGYYWFDTLDSAEVNISYGDNFTCRAKTTTGYYLMSGFSFTIIEYREQLNVSITYPQGSPSSITGAFQYTKIKDAYGISDVSDYMSWDLFYNHAVKDQHKEYTTYHEDEDGILSVASDRVMTLYLYYNRSQYTVSFSPNGGTGSPDSITQYYNYSITIPDYEPSRKGYFFLGWSPSSSSSRATHQAGDSYTVSGDITFYAVWDKDDYEFSISNLAVTNGNIYANSVIQVNVRTDSWDDDQAYTNIPVELYYDERLIATQYVDFEIYGITWVTFEINVGTVTGGHEIMVWINRERWIWEVDKTNNTVTTVINVLPEEYAFEITPIESNAPYKEDTTVMTSYLIYNDGIQNVYPETGMSVNFTVYYLDSDGERVVIDTQTWENYVIPKTATNLVYFKWTVPDGLAGGTVYCECTVNADGNIGEINRENNTATLSAVIAERVYSQTLNPSFAAQKPDDYTEADLPAESIGSASWSMWVYEDESFYLKEFGVKISDGVPTVAPDEDCLSATQNGSGWTMKSGYGITMEYAPVISALSGAQMPSENAYSDLQSVYATFEEYGYGTTQGRYSDLVLVDGVWCFSENEDSGDRIHYVPIWLPDGEYIVSVTVTELWTPVGRITAVRSSNVIIIDGNLYDDWYN